MVRLLLLLVAVLAPLTFGQSTDTVMSTRSSPSIPPPQRRPASSGCSPDRRTDPNAGVLISEVFFEGPTLSSSELSVINSQLTGTCFDEQNDVIEQHVRNAFADRGFAQAEVNVTLKASDALAVPKPVTLKVDVTEGPRFRIGEIKFVDNHAFSTAKLRAAFPIKRGTVFQRSKIVSGLREIRKLYTRHGYSDLVSVPDIQFSSTGTVALKISISEGPQYHMGELKVYAKKETADHLASEWQLREGAVFNLNYPQTFIDKSHSIPSGFSRQNIRLVRNCPDATIAVLVIVDQTDPKLQTLPKDVPCEKPEGGAY